MKPVTAIVADDEKNLRDGLCLMLNRLWPELEIVGEAQNGIEARELIKRDRPEIAFLDIKMPGQSGIEVAKTVSHISTIVFITAFDQFAVQAFESEAVDYILKPVSEDRLKRAIERLKRRFMGNPAPDDLEKKIQKVIQVLQNQETPDYLRLVKVKTGSELRFVPVSQVLYFKAEDKYTIVQTADREHLIKTPIKELENRLDPGLFWRVHRSSIVNIEKLTAIKRSFTNQMVIVFEPFGHTIAVSRSYEHLFRQM